MCGAFSIRINPSMADFLQDVQAIKPWEPIYNARPGEWLPMVTETKPHKLTSAYWGFVPHWMDPKQGSPVINARGETVMTKPYFRKAFAGQRCIIPADGFYEWEKNGRLRLPHYFRRRDDQPFAFAGLYDALPKTPTKFGFAIITTTPNTMVGKIHDRMPAMLPDEAVAAWLNPDTAPEHAAELIQPYPDRAMVSYPVSRAVNSAKHKGADVIEPFQETGKLV